MSAFGSRLKPGSRPKKEGRSLQIHVMVNVDEDEYVARRSFELGLSKSEFMRREVPKNFKQELERLRREQKSVSQVFRKVP